MHSSRRGFTLVELMVVLVIIGILASVALVRYNTVLAKAHEGATKGSLGTLRSALHVYFADTEGTYPTTIAVLTNIPYINVIPNTELGKLHTDTNVSAETPTAAAPTDAGGWFYDGDPSSLNVGTLWVNCTHADSAGSVWTSY